MPIPVPTNILPRSMPHRLWVVALHSHKFFCKPQKVSYMTVTCNFSLIVMDVQEFLFFL